LNTVKENQKKEKSLECVRWLLNYRKNEILTVNAKIPPKYFCHNINQQLRLHIDPLEKKRFWRLLHEYINYLCVAVKLYFFIVMYYYPAITLLTQLLDQSIINSELHSDIR
jgi:hypothetical protein